MPARTPANTNVQMIVQTILYTKAALAASAISQPQNCLAHGVKTIVPHSIPQANIPPIDIPNGATKKNTPIIAKDFLKAKGSMFLGRGLSFPIALEGALKLKELSYLHAEGYPAGEMKHGPLALIEEGLPVVILAPKDRYFEKTISNMQEVIARGGKVILITNEDNKIIRENVRFTLEVPMTNEHLTPFLMTIPLQLLAYHVASLKNCDIDKPRNLAKSVTVE